MSKHGYEVRAEEVFWVNQGILRSTELRDSMDEQCIADVSACIVGGQLIERAKDALDEIYTEGTTEADRVLTALEIYGVQRFSEEFKFCVDEILKVCAANGPVKLRDVVFGPGQTNAFPSVFAILIIAFHELIVKENKIISDYSGVKANITQLTKRIDTTRRATSVEERRRNIDTIKGLVASCFVEGKPAQEIYGNHTTMDIEAVVRRSEIELGNYELKQGLLSLADKGGIDPNMIDKVVRTICAIANNGPGTSGKILIGVTDKEHDVARVKIVDGTEAKKVGKRYVVGVVREAVRLGISTEKYYSLWKDGIKNSALTPGLRDGVLSNMDFNSFYGLGVIVLTVTPQTEISYVGEELFWRNGDATERADSPKQIAALAQRF